jgi:hypothetical protein
MKVLRAALVFALLLGGMPNAFAQDKAGVNVVKGGALKAGGSIAFDVSLNEPLPKGAHFDFRISPVSADEEVSLGAGQPVDESRKTFRVSGVLPEGALPGEWHISIVWLFLPGTGWTRNSIATNNLRFEVEGKAYAFRPKPRL